ncbi:hypothetical protein RvY_19227 [Ramazzottius varieornatus]|uniref:Uncharacterized protein n=1 Tax=Ramazzottius varieornatus TaxID=947166 RepID=A0A1D1WC60_RAMVA|nr:hypothetical protein RvY_19227 [Ramazzottius varieornatus]
MPRMWRAVHISRTACVTNQERNRRNNSAPSSQSVDPADQLIATKPIHEVLQHLKVSTKVIRRIPKGTHMLAATSLTERIEDVLQKRSESSWRHLMLFSFAGLKQPDKDKSKKGNRTTAVKSNLSRQLVNLELNGKQTVKKQPKDQLSLPEEVTVEEMSCKKFPQRICWWR